jgi:hypothetical protein
MVRISIRLSDLLDIKETRQGRWSALGEHEIFESEINISIEEAGRHPADSLRIQPADAEKCGVVLLDIYGIDPPGHD